MRHAARAATRSLHAHPGGGRAGCGHADPGSKGALLIRYFDASALVKRYVDESGSRNVGRLLATGDAATSRVSEVEVVSALARRAREGDIGQADCDRAIAAVSDDFAALHVVELLPEVTALARSLLRRQVLRAADALQLASCLYLGEQLAEPVPLVAFDDRLRAAARAERVRVLPSRLSRAGSSRARPPRDRGR